MLINYGANVNSCDNVKNSPLFIACQNGNNEIVKLLLFNKADVNLQNIDGINPQRIASQMKFDKTVKLLQYHVTDIAHVETSHSAAGSKEFACQIFRESEAERRICENEDVA